MNRTLVLTIDRDDDLGVKAGLRGPIIGRRNVLAAALKLGIADPEESDTNAILGALQQHDFLVDEDGEDEISIAILTGDERVGVRSDRAIAMQLEEVIDHAEPDRVVVVTDGAEDETLLPIIQSRLRIDHVHRIVVKQSKGLEGTYYYIAKALDDPGMRRRIVIPVSLVLILIGAGISFGQPWMIGALPLLLGGWLLARGLGAENLISRIILEMNANTDGAMITTVLWSIALISAILAGTAAWETYSDGIGLDHPSSLLVLTALRDSLTWVLLTFLFTALGSMVLAARRGHFRKRVVVMSIFVLTIWEFTRNAVRISIDRINNGTDYAFDVQQIQQDWSGTLLLLVAWWITWRAMKAFDPTGDEGRRFHGV